MARQQFALRLEELFKELGFSRHPNSSATGEALEFSAPLFPGYEKSVLIVFHGPPKSRELDGFGISLQVTSVRQAQVRDELDILGCYQLQHEEPVHETEVAILGVGMMGLISMWGDPGEMEEMVPLRWTRTGEYPCERLAEEVHSHVRTKGEKFFSHVESPEQLAKVLLNLENFPGVKSKGAGPGSSSRWEFASVLLRDQGRPDLALQAMNLGIASIREQVSLGEVFPEALELAECVFERYRPWFSPH